MKNRPDGGPAFPVCFDHDIAISEHPGMSLREWYAGKALEGMIAYHGLAKLTETQIDRAQLILQQVDALLNELEKEVKP